MVGTCRHVAQPDKEFNPLKPNDSYRGRTAPLTSQRCILYIYSTNIGTEYFKHGTYSPLFFSSKCSLFHNSNVSGSCIIHILYTGVLKLKKHNSGAKRLTVVIITTAPPVPQSIHAVSQIPRYLFICPRPIPVDPACPRRSKNGRFRQRACRTHV